MSLAESDLLYLYRYSCLPFNKNLHGFGAASPILETEKRMAGLMKIDLIGQRFVGKKI